MVTSLPLPATVESQMALRTNFNIMLTCRLSLGMCVSYRYGTRTGVSVWCQCLGLSPRACICIVGSVSQQYHVLVIVTFREAKIIFPHCGTNGTCVCLVLGDSVIKSYFLKMFLWHIIRSHIRRSWGVRYGCTMYWYCTMVVAVLYKVETWQRLFRSLGIKQSSTTCRSTNTVLNYIS